MDAINAIRVMIKRSGKRQTQVSEDIGRSYSYVGTVLAKACPPQVDTLAAIAAACGYRLALIGRDGDRIDIDAPER